MEQWKFYAEIGASTDAGGEIVVRSIGGPASIGRPTTAGALLRMGYDTEARPQILALQNIDRSPMTINWDLSEQQRRMLNANASSAGAIPPGTFDGGASAPIQNPGVATQPGVPGAF
jgi:hypothetical protein